MQKVIAAIAISSCLSCATTESSEMKPAMYLDVSNSKISGFEIDLEQGKYKTIGGTHLWGGTADVFVCPKDSEFYCFGNPFNDDVVAVHKNIRQFPRWIYDTFDYTVVHEYSVPGCGMDYVIHARKDNTLRLIMVYNLHLGLKTYAPAFPSPQNISAELSASANESEKIHGPTPLGMFVATGAGVGYYGPCSTAR
jgi:hypothetical protein